MVDIKDKLYLMFVKDGRPGIKGRNGGYHPTSLSYLNSEDKFKIFNVFQEL